MKNAFRDVVADGVDLAHNIPVYGDFVEAFYTSIRLYDPAEEKPDILAVEL